MQCISDPAPPKQVALPPSPPTKVFGDVLPNIQRETYVPSSIPPAPHENGASDVATADGASDETEENEETGIDAEALAQEVYRRLKRRLQFDRERSGRV
jgi:hypothetical protein